MCIERRTIHLYGIHIPDLGRSCDSRQRPAVCGTRAAIALDFKIDGFVRCKLLSENADGSYIGQCRVNASSFEE